MNISPELKKRLLTGLIGSAALVGLIVFGGGLGIFFLVAALSLGMVFEFSGITFNLVDRTEKRYLLLSLTWAVALLNAIAPQFEFQLLIACFIAVFTYYLFSAKRHEESLLISHLRELTYSMFGIVYLIFVPLFLIRIYDSPNGTEWTLLFLLIVWAGDSSAYFAGKKYGRRKLYPLISPKKTYEGSLGGLAGGVVIALFCKFIFFQRLSWVTVFCLPLVVGVFAQIGDLCESLFKRAFDIKDSGSILPGHGGFLDRFDSVVFSLPVMYACVRIFG